MKLKLFFKCNQNPNTCLTSLGDDSVSLGGFGLSHYMTSSPMFSGLSKDPQVGAEYFADPETSHSGVLHL